MCPSGDPATQYSIMDILERENAFPDEPNTQLIEDIMSTSGPSLRDIMKGEVDPYGDIYAEYYVIKDDLYGVYGIKTYFTFFTGYHFPIFKYLQQRIQS